MCFLRYKNRTTLAPPRLGKANLNFHVERLSKLIQTSTDRVYIALLWFPRCLDGHAELTARDLLFQSFDIGFLFKKEISDFGNDTRFVATDDCNCCKQFHECVLMNRIRFGSES